MGKMNNIENFNRDLLVKYLNNEVSSDEKLEVESWLKQSAKNREELEQSRQMLEKVDAYFEAKTYNSKAAWNNVHSKITQSQPTIGRKKLRKEAIIRFYKYAAILVVAVLLGTLGYYIGFNSQNTDFFSEVIAAEEQVVNEFILPDGSMVALNSNSKLKFPKQFKDDVREIFIEGEAFFDVKPNPDKPFIIHAGNAQIKVLGTSFNVCAYPNTETVEVIVKTGKVQVNNVNPELSNDNSEVVLVPGEKGTLFNTTNVLEKALNSDPNYIAWKTRDLVFNEVPLKEVFKNLEKVYHVDIQVSDPKLNDLLLEAQFDHKPIDFVLNVIQITFDLDLKKENEQFIFSERKNKQVKL